MPLTAWLLASTLQAGAPSATVSLREPADVVVTLEVGDAAAADSPFSLAPAALLVDGALDQEILVQPGLGRSSYEAVVRLPAGRHILTVRSSSYWAPHPAVVWRRLSARAIEGGDREHDVIAYAPRLYLRADTIGGADDVPLYVYAESEEAGGERRLRYTVVFSNEDGGTPALALLARWGRSADIELAYDVRLREGRVVEEHFQGPDHGVPVFTGAHRGTHPLLLVATLNNVFLDRGRTPVEIAPRPQLVELGAAPREATLDDKPWAYAALARELAAEGKLHGRSATAAPPPRDQVVDDPRRYLYAEARTTLHGSAVAARATFGDGAGTSSHHGDARLAIGRDGWIRTAIPLGVHRREDVVQLSWECLPGATPVDGDTPRCSIEATRAFVLSDDYRPGATLVAPRQLELRAGESQALPITPPR
jgi:hypothetical protein